MYHRSWGRKHYSKPVYDNIGNIFIETLIASFDTFDVYECFTDYIASSYIVFIQLEVNEILS